MRIGYLGLGSNVGDRRANLQAAVEDLWAHDVVVLASSSVCLSRGGRVSPPPLHHRENIERTIMGQLNAGIVPVTPSKLNE